MGQVGAIIAAAPLTLALQAFGWTRAFALASSVGLVLMVVVAVVVKDSPYRRTGAERIKLRALARAVSLVWGNPGTRLGMWTHFSSSFSMTVFTMLWGFPFLVRGQGLSEAAAGTLLMAMTGWVIVAGLTLSWAVTRFPYHRSWIVLGVVAAMVVAWTAVLARSDPSPLWLAGRDGVRHGVRVARPR